MPDNSNHRAYLTARFTQLNDAIMIGDGDAAVSVFTQMAADGYGTEADRIMDGLIEIGLRNLADRIADGTASVGILAELLAVQRPESETSALSALGTRLKTAPGGNVTGWVPVGKGREAKNGASS